MKASIRQISGNLWRQAMVVSGRLWLPFLDIITGVEEGLSKAKISSVSTEIRSSVHQVLAKARRNPSINLDREETAALKALKKDESIVIISADKGSATVVINRADYDKKIKPCWMMEHMPNWRQTPRKELKDRFTRYFLSSAGNMNWTRNCTEDSIQATRVLHASMVCQRCANQTYPYDPLLVPLDQPLMILPNI